MSGHVRVSAEGRVSYADGCSATYPLVLVDRPFDAISHGPEGNACLPCAQRDLKRAAGLLLDEVDRLDRFASERPHLAQCSSDPAMAANALRHAARDMNVLAAMRRHGGSFVKALAEAAGRADLENLGRLRRAFPELWERYATAPAAPEGQP